MDEAERVPIDIGYAVEAEAPAADGRTTVREDGTIVIDILAAQPCAPEPSTEDAIVVCGVIPADRRLPPPPAAPDMPQRLGEALNTRIGPVELGSIANRDGTRFWGLRLRF